MSKSRSKRKKSWTRHCDCVDCVPGCDCDFFLIGRLLTLLALRTPGRPRLTRPSTPARAGIAMINGYRRHLSHRLPTACRHTPTCSSYGLDAVGRYGLLTGSRLIVGRLRRCNGRTPFGTADPVP